MRKSGIESLKQDVDDDCRLQGGRFAEHGCSISCSRIYCAKYRHIIKTARDYAQLLQVPYTDVLASWESHRRYIGLWYMLYYSNDKQIPLDTTGRAILIYDTEADLRAAASQQRYVCPRCNQVGVSPYHCEACGAYISSWFEDYGKGALVISRERMIGVLSFRPSNIKQGGRYDYGISHL